MGMSFEDGRNIIATQRFGRFHLFSLGGIVRNCLSGTIDDADDPTFEADATTFEYEYDNGGEFSSTVRQTVVLFHSNELSLPDFELQPRTYFHKFNVLRRGRKEIDFDSRPDFSKPYLLSGNDESAIRQVFSRSVLEYFERHQGLSVESRNKRLLFYRHNKHVFFDGTQVRPDKIKLFLDEGRAVLGLFCMKS